CSYRAAVPGLEDLFGERLNVTVLRLLSQVRAGMSGNAIARRLDLHQSAARKALERLVERGVVTRTDVGRSASYALDTRRAIVRHIVLPVFRAEAALGRLLQERLQHVTRELDPAPVAVVLYGSTARAARTPRDVDLLVVLQRANHEQPARIALLEAVRPIERSFQVAVNPVVLTARELDARADDPLVTAIATDGVLLAGRAVGPLRRVR